MYDKPDEVSTYQVIVWQDSNTRQVHERNLITVKLFLQRLGLKPNVIKEKEYLDLELERAELIREVCGPLRFFAKMYEDTFISYIYLKGFLVESTREFYRLLESLKKQFDELGIHISILYLGATKRP